MLKIILYFQFKMRSSGVFLLSTLMVGSFSRPQQDQNLNYEMELQGGRELMDIENVSLILRKSPTTRLKTPSDLPLNTPKT